MKNEIPVPGISPWHYAIEAREATAKDFDEQNKTQIDTALAEINNILTVKLIAIV